jgi:SAM-dependent methyltransferase
MLVGDVDVWRSGRSMSLRAGAPAVPATSTRQFGLFDYYLTSLWAGLRALPGRRYTRESIARIVNPLSYPRLMEYELVMELLGDVSGCRILDIGSPKLPVLVLARHTKSQIFATDIRDYFVGPTAHFLRRIGLASRLVDIHLEVQDGRRLTYADDSFDKVFSISVLEHIPDDGDGLALREIARVLRPGGVVALTVPFRAAGHHDEYVSGDVYERKATGAPTFYQRRYDLKTLEERLIAPSGLELTAMIPFGEPHVAFERYWNAIPLAWKLPVLWTQPFVAKALLRRLPMDRVDLACGMALRLTKREH